MDRLEYLIRYLAPEEKVPSTYEEREWILRALMNTWIPQHSLDDEFLKLQDEYLQEKLEKKGIVDIENLKETEKNIYLWQGDITSLKVDAIVNAANKKLLGCFVAHHKCIDNAIHSQAGLQLRMQCANIMSKQGKDEETGKAKITDGFNLPAKYVIHTVGPIIYDQVEKRDVELLRKCYVSCLQVARERRIKSIAFCCISTGEFRFPRELAAEIAVDTVRRFTEKYNDIKVVFNVFKDEDRKIYEKLLDEKNNKKQ